MRRIRAVRMLAVAGAVFLASAVTAFAGGTMQKAPTGQMQKAPGQIEKKAGAGPAITTPIRVEAQAVVVTVGSSTTPDVSLKAGDRVTVTLTIKNTGSSPAARVPWWIQVIPGPQRSGEQTNMAPGETRSVSVQWTARAGPHGFFGWVDPAHKVGVSGFVSPP